MYLYNITLIIEPTQEREVIDTVQKMVQQMDAEGAFHTGAPDLPDGSAALNFLKLLDSQHEGATYCLHLRAADQQTVESFRNKQLQEIQSALSIAYPDQVLYFESLMEYL